MLTSNQLHSYLLNDKLTIFNPLLIFVRIYFTILIDQFVWSATFFLVFHLKNEYNLNQIEEEEEEEGDNCDLLHKSTRKKLVLIETKL